MQLTFFIAVCMVLCFRSVAKKSVDNTPLFQLLLKSACTAPRPFCFLLCPLPGLSGDGQEVGRRHSKDRCPTWPKGQSTPYNVMFSNKTGVGKEGGGEFCLPRQTLFHE